MTTSPIWINGQIDRSTGVIVGINASQRVEISNSAVPGTRYVIAVLVAILIGTFVTRPLSQTVETTKEIARGQLPFLHVLADNRHAQRVYERMGFRFHQEVALRIVSGLSVQEIARAFLVSEAAMARIIRERSGRG